MVKSFKILKKQVLIILVFSLMTSIVAIIHGIFFDLKFDEIKRLTFEGIVLTLLVIFPIILFLEWVFDINNKKEHDNLEQRIIKLEKKKK